MSEPHTPTKAEIHSTLIRHPVWARLTKHRAREVLTTLLGESGGIEGLKAPLGEDLWGRAIFRVRRKVSTIARQLGMSASTVTRALAELRAAELVFTVRTGRSSVFELILPTPRKASHGAGREEAAAPRRPIRSVKADGSDRSRVTDPHSRSLSPGRLRQQAPPPPNQPAVGEAEPDRDRAAVVSGWTSVAIGIGFKPYLAERVAASVLQHGEAGRTAGIDRFGVLNVLEHVHEQIARRGTGNAHGAIRRPEALVAHLIRAGGCEPSLAAQRRQKQRAAAAYARVREPAMVAGRLIDVQG